MQDCPRRTVLRGIGAALPIGAVGSLPASAGDTRSGRASARRREWADADEFGDLFEYVPASAAADELVFGAIDYAAMREANGDRGSVMPVRSLDVETESLSKGVLLQDGQYGGSPALLVLTGDVALDGEGEVVEAPTGEEYERYERDSTVVAAIDDRLVVAESTDALDDALAAKAGERERLLDGNDVVADGIDAFGDADTRAVMIGEDDGYGQTFDAEIRFTGYATTVRDPDTLERTFAVGIEDESNTEPVADALEENSLFGSGDEEHTTVETDGRLVIVTTVVDLAARRQEREHESPGRLTVDREDIRSDAEFLELEVGEGDPTPVDELTLEVGEETYERSVWAGEQETIEGGDTIRLRMADVEPNLRVTLRHEQEYSASATTTTILGRFEFEFDYDFGTRTLEIEYADEFDLDGDELHVVLYEERDWWDDDVTPASSATPWAGETVTAGSTVSVEDVDPGEFVFVSWGGVDPQDGIGYFSARPPGDVSFEYDYGSRAVTATLDLEDARAADQFELLVDDEPADSQWADEYDTVSTGDSVTVEGVEIGSHVRVVWGESDARVGGTRATPSVEIDLVQGEEAEIEHVGGDELPASKLVAHVWNEGRTVVDLDDEIDGTFAEGDAAGLGVDLARHVSLLYGGEHYVGFASHR